MSKLNILVTGVGSEVGQGVIKALRLSKYTCNIVGCDMNSDSAGFFMCDSYHVVPGATSSTYLKKMIKICEDNNIKIVFPVVDAELRTIMENQVLFKEINVLVISQPIELLDIFLTKYNTHQFLKNNNISTPATLFIENKTSLKEIIGKLNFPLILKPDFGQGSKNIYLVHNRKELRLYLMLIKSKRYVAQQYLSAENEEYTCAVFNCKYLKKPYVIVFKRKLIEGTSGVAEVVFDKNIMLTCKKVVEYSNLEGSINIQLRKLGNTPFIFEINPRYSSTAGIRANCGFNDVEMAIDYFLFNEVPVKPNVCKEKILRYKEEIYIKNIQKNEKRKNKF